MIKVQYLLMCDKGAIPTEDLTDESSMIGNPNFEDIPSDEHSR